MSDVGTSPRTLSPSTRADRSKPHVVRDLGIGTVGIGTRTERGDPGREAFQEWRRMKRGQPRSNELPPIQSPREAAQKLKANVHEAREQHQAQQRELAATTQQQSRQLLLQAAREREELLELRRARAKADRHAADATRKAALDVHQDDKAKEQRETRAALQREREESRQAVAEMRAAEASRIAESKALVRAAHEASKAEIANARQERLKAVQDTKVRDAERLSKWREESTKASTERSQETRQLRREVHVGVEKSREALREDVTAAVSKTKVELTNAQSVLEDRRRERDARLRVDVAATKEAMASRYVEKLEELSRGRKAAADELRHRSLADKAAIEAARAERRDEARERRRLLGTSEGSTTVTPAVRA
jgi:hypothetical protein